MGNDQCLCKFQTFEYLCRTFCIKTELTFILTFQQSFWLVNNCHQLIISFHVIYSINEQAIIKKHRCSFVTTLNEKLIYTVHFVRIYFERGNILLKLLKPPYVFKCYYLHAVFTVSDDKCQFWNRMLQNDAKPFLFLEG